MYCTRCGHTMEKGCKPIRYDCNTGKPIYNLYYNCKNCGMGYASGFGDELIKRWWLGEELSLLDKAKAVAKYYTTSITVSDFPGTI